MNDQAFEWIASYGIPAFFGILVISSAGVPFPITLMLLVSGSLIEQGEMEFWQILLFGSLGVIIGDQIGYGLGKYGGRKLVNFLTKYTGGADKVEESKKFTKRWGGSGIFFSRWLITPLGPWINITSGITDYPWKKFLLWSVLGEILWVLIYVMLGRFFSDYIQDIVNFAGNLTWVFVGLIITFILGWSLISSFRHHETASS